MEGHIDPFGSWPTSSPRHASVIDRACAAQMRSVASNLIRLQLNAKQHSGIAIHRGSIHTSNPTAQAHPADIGRYA